MSFLIYTMSKMSWNIYYKYVANAPENETQFPRGEHPGPCLFLPPSVVVSSPPPPPPHSKFGSVILAYRQQLQFPQPSIVVAKWRGWGMLKSYHLYTFCFFLFVCLCLFVFLIIILEFCFINLQHFASNSWVYWG